MKQCKSYATKNTSISQKRTHNHPSGPTSTSELSNDFIHMLKTSGLEDGNNQQNSTKFQFNFEMSSQERSIAQTLPNNIHTDLSNPTTQYNPSHSKTLNYEPSDNTFRFEFNA